MQNIEDTSLEYIEDPYFNPQVSSATPSLDEPDLDEYDLLENELDLFDLRQLDFDEVVHNSLYSYPDESESVNVEAEFFNVKRANLIIRTFFKNKLKKQVRVTYCDLTKPYLAKLPKDSNFRRYLDITTNEEAMAAAETPIPDLSHLSTEERAEQERLWKEELATIEDEISTLRTVLASKMRRSAELKRNLGITVWKEVTDDINQGIKNVKESNVYQTVETKVGQVTKAVTDAPIYQKTSSLLGGITGNITNKIGQMRHSESFKSFEEKVGSAYENVKTKVASRSGSQHSLDEAGRSRSGSTVTSPTIPEDKPLA
ncbi:uncharacterized protein F13E6.1 isoform X2 [Diabrotica virgifera virgifera]|uniref:Tumor protein D54 n=1 Tax=Diabrotica virgifera virgifera TaxID=50390 RepID=A0ABM5INB7_DIAVI|nr:uncharacterized protein F13E6.1 isoform X2 [Diabrotica virgifera virgifera]